MTSKAPTTWTTRTLLAWMIDAFTKKELDSPRLMAELLVAHVVGCERLKLYMDADRPASPEERERLRELVGRALRHEPVQYLVGEAWFFGLPLHVAPGVLIPRSCTELIIEQVLLHARAEPGFGGKTGEGMRFADICTGSGCIAVTLLKQLSGATAIATDISEDALGIARKNAERHKVADRIEFLQGDLCRPLLDHPAGRAGGSDLHYVVSNPPYIPDAEWNDPAQMGANVKGWEPEIALRGGPDGMQYIRPLIEHAPEMIRAHGLLMIETAAGTARQVSKLMASNPLIDDGKVRIVKDLEGHDRLVIGMRRG